MPFGHRMGVVIHSMVERDSEAEIIPYCMEHNIGFVPFSPIASGLLSGKITTQTQFERNDDVRNWVPQLSRENIAGNQPIIDLLGTYADLKQATRAQISLAWMLKKYPNVVPIPGSKNKGRIIENLDAAKVKLTDEEFASLEEALNQCRVYGHRGLGGF
jgi:aryl-alcohol dehydrogenase-like predicted oxidoreductase